MQTVIKDSTDYPYQIEDSADFPYQDGEVIPQRWHIEFIFLAYVTAFIGSYSAIRLLEHGLWRSERERENATIFSKYPRFATAFVLGSCTIWSMHFIGMQAVEKEGVATCYQWLPTLGSLCLSVTGVWGGVSVASWDIFSGEDRVEVLKQLLQNDPMVTSKMNRRRASNRIRMTALFYKLHWIGAGSMLAALGALSMHYVGMIAMMGPFHREWSVPYLAASVLVGVVVAFAGFWILFRPLHWKVEKSSYRYASAGIIAGAVCSLHFLGMLSVTYIADSSQNVGMCGKDHAQGWTPQQLKVFCVAMAVPIIAFMVEHAISNEHLVTYRQLLDVQLQLEKTIARQSQIMSDASRHSLGVSSGALSSSNTLSSSRNKSHPRRGAVKVSGLTLDSTDETSNETSPTKRISLELALSHSRRSWHRFRSFFKRAAEDLDAESVKPGEETADQQHDDISAWHNENETEQSTSKAVKFHSDEEQGNPPGDMNQDEIMAAALGVLENRPTPSLSDSSSGSTFQDVETPLDRRIDDSHEEERVEDKQETPSEKLRPFQVKTSPLLEDILEDLSLTDDDDDQRSPDRPILKRLFGSMDDDDDQRSHGRPILKRLFGSTGNLMEANEDERHQPFEKFQEITQTFQAFLSPPWSTPAAAPARYSRSSSIRASEISNPTPSPTATAAPFRRQATAPAQSLEKFQEKKQSLEAVCESWTTAAAAAPTQHHSRRSRLAGSETTDSNPKPAAAPFRRQATAPAVSLEKFQEKTQSLEAACEPVPTPPAAPIRHSRRSRLSETAIPTSTNVIETAATFRRQATAPAVARQHINRNSSPDPPRGLGGVYR